MGLKSVTPVIPEEVSKKPLVTKLEDVEVWLASGLMNMNGVEPNVALNPEIVAGL
jgi:hypothetical protein